MAVPAPVSSAFCVPYEAQLEIDRTDKAFSNYAFKFAINDAQGNLLFDAQDKTPGFHPFSQTKLVLLDASGKVVLLLTEKRLSVHGKWAVYRGDDDIEENLLFTVGHSSGFSCGSSFNVFLATNPNSSIPDFTVKKETFGKTYTFLYRGTPFAEARKKSGASMFSRKNPYVITAYPGADHAFLAALLVVIIVDRIRQEQAAG